MADAATYGATPDAGAESEDTADSEAVTATVKVMFS